MRKLFLTTAITALAVMIVGTSTAQALVARDGTTGQVCSDVQVFEGGTTVGGCLVEDMQGTWNLASGSMQWDYCTGSWDLRVDGTADYTAVNQHLACSAIWRAACAEDDGTTKPWPATHPSMPVCMEDSGHPQGQESWAPVSWAFTFGPNGEVLEQNQTSAPLGFGNGSFENTGATNEVLVTVN